MIYLFHGENQPALRDALLALKREYDEAFFWEKGLEDLPVYLASPGLFARRELVIVEDPELDRIFGFLESFKGGEKDIVFVFSDKVSMKKLPEGREIKICYFREEIPRNVFPFLDALVAKNRKSAFVQAHQLVRGGTDPHFLLAMIVWQMRNLVQIKDEATGGIHPYVSEKLRRMEKNFSGAELSQAFSLLLKEDLAAKRRGVDSTTLDFLIEKLTRR